MKLNNKGFAISTFMYMLLVLAIILILAIIAILSSRKMILDKQKSNTLEKVSQSRNPICEATGGVKSLELGTEYECHVNDEKAFNFYVISVEGNKVNLIMDRNICEDGTYNYNNDPDSNWCRYSWHSGENNNNYGPDTAMNALYESTKTWTNVPNPYFSYTDENNTNDNTKGYTSLKIINGVVTITGKNNAGNTTIGSSDEPIKARLPKENEVTQAGCGNTNGSCPTWLVKNLKYINVTSAVGNDKYSMNNNSEAYQNINGYWLLSSFIGNATGGTHVYNMGRTDYYVNSTSGTGCGIRPVITLPKSMLK